MFGRTPPWAIVTPDISLLSSSSFLAKDGISQLKNKNNYQLPDSQLQVSGDDARFLVVPGSVPGQLEDLGGQVFHHSGHVDGCAGAHPLGVVALPEEFV